MSASSQAENSLRLTLAYVAHDAAWNGVRVNPAPCFLNAVLRRQTAIGLDDETRLIQEDL